MKKYQNTIEECKDEQENSETNINQNSSSHDLIVRHIERSDFKRGINFLKPIESEGYP